MSAPPLPDILPFPGHSGDTQDEAPSVASQAISPKTLKPGCWLLNYAPTDSTSVQYDGTFRIESINGGLRASGDLYQRPARIRSQARGPRLVLIPAGPPNPADGIPVLPIDRYAFFIRATHLLESFSLGSSIELGLELWRYSHTAWNADPNVFPKWVETIPCTATMKWVLAPSLFPVRSSYLEGIVSDQNGRIMGKMTMGWISTFLRKVTVEIDTVAGSEAPTDSGSGHDWKTVGDDMGYDVKMVMSEQTVPEMSGNAWSNSEMNSAMIAHRDSNDLNSEWRYHILAVKNIDITHRGIMYDDGATDSNKVPREGVGISTHWIIPSGWGSSSGVRFGLAKAAHFRTAVHELGHAFGLEHNTIDLGFMNTSDVIARNGNTGPTKFPDNIKWAFADDDLKRLRHRSDMYIRPGGVQFQDINDIDPSPTTDSRSLVLDIPDLELTLTPLLTEVPLGAPVRVDIKLTNNGKDSIPIPARIDLKSENIRGVVTDPSGTVRTFKSLIGCLDESVLVELAPYQSITQSVTLLRGGEGALFPLSGVSKIAIQLHWSIPIAFGDGEEQTTAPDHEVSVSAITSVFIIGANSESHAKAAHKILSSPDMHLLIAFGGGSEPKCCENALKSVLECGVLVPHWEFFVMKERAIQGDPAIKGMYVQSSKGLIASRGEKVKLEKLLK